MTGGIRENGLNRAHLELILLEAFHDRVDRERLPELNTSIDRSVCDVGKRGNSHRTKGDELGRDTFEP